MRNVKNDIVKVENYLIYDIITSWDKVIFRIKKCYGKYVDKDKERLYKIVGSFQLKNERSVLLCIQ